MLKHQIQNNLHVNIRRTPGSFQCYVTLYSQGVGDKVNVLTLQPDGYFLSTQHDINGTDIPPTFKADEDIMREIIAAFVELAEREKITLEGTESFTKGKLEATESHLEDMRTLVFKKK